MGPVRVLGEIEVLDDEAAIPVRSSKQRLLLALLAATDAPMTPDRLIEGLWGEDPPPTARATLTGYVSRLRGVIGSESIEGGPSGYRLRVGEIDARRFEATVERALETEDREELAAALESWAGDPFAEFADHPFLVGMADRLRELRTSARIRLAALYLEAADLARPVSMLEAVIQHEPIREDAWLLLVRSLLASDRPAEAVRSAHRCRRQLAEVGLEPSGALTELEAEALGQRAALASRDDAEAADTDTEVEIDIEIGSVRYTRHGTVHLGYQTVGGGAVDLVLSSYGSVSFDSIWDSRHFAGFVSRLAARCRIVLYDTRGIGLSDPIDPNSPPSIELQGEDLMVVVDAAQATRPVLVGVGDGGPTVIAAAHAHPDRVAGLVLVNTFARLSRASDYPIGVPAEVLAENITTTTDHATTRDTSHVLRNHAPSVAGDPGFRRWWERAGRRGASPATAAALWQVRYGADVRSQLSELAVPTLVLHSSRARVIPKRYGLYLAETIPGAHFAEVNSADQPPFTEPAEEIAELITHFVQSLGK